MLAIAFHVLGACIAAGEGYGRRLRTVSGASSARPAQRVRRAQTAGWVLSIVGSVRIFGLYWGTEPLWLEVWQLLCSAWSTVFPVWWLLRCAMESRNGPDVVSAKIAIVQTIRGSPYYAVAR